VSSSRFEYASGPVGRRPGLAVRWLLLGTVAGAILGAPVLRAEPAAAPGLVLSEAWVRAMPPGQAMTAAYLQVLNTGETPVTVTGVSTGMGTASLHETRVVEGRSTMRPVAALTLAPGEQLQLQPGGLHVMLMGLERTPVPGEDVSICLVTDAGESCIDAPVSRGPVVGGTDAGHHH
jgi:copper(I)-binding protein